MSKTENKSAKNLLNLPLSTLLFYLGMTVLIFLKSVGFSSSDKVFLMATIGSLIFFSIKIILTKYSKTDIFIFGIFLFFSVMSVVQTHRLTLLLTVITLIAAKNVELNSILSLWLRVVVIGIILILLGAAVGFVDISVVSHYRPVTGDMETRYFINGMAGNGFHLQIFTICVLYLYKRWPRVRFLDVFLTLLINFIVYFTITKSLTGMLMTTAGVLLIYICAHLNKIVKGLIFVAPFLPYAMLATMLTIATIYGSSPFLEYINNLSTGRIAYDHYFLSNYGIPPLGSNYSQLIEEGFFDDSFVYIPVIYGGIFAILIYGAVTIALIKAKKNDNVPKRNILVVLIVLYLIYSVAESMYPSIIVNPSLFIIFYFLCPPNATKKVDAISNEYAKTVG